MTDSSNRSPFVELVDIMARLRAPGGCPWDREQDHATLKPYLLEEAYEVLDAIDAPLVSADFNHSPQSSVFDLTQTQVMGGNLVRVLSWYDNEWGFSNRMSDTATVLAGAD